MTSKPDSAASVVSQVPLASAFGTWPGMIVLTVLLALNVSTRPGQAEPFAPTASPRTYLTNICAMLAKQWPTNRTVNIACHGHSVPAGYFKTPVVDTFNAYPYLLHRALKEQYPTAVINITVTANGGEDSESGRRRFERDVLTFKPDVVTIDYGLNDRRIGLAAAEEAWRGMITNAIAHGAKVILLTPTPDQEAHWDNPDDPLNQQARQIRRLAAEYGTGLVDSLEVFRAKVQAGTRLEELMSQSNHPNRPGHELVAGELMKWFSTP